MQFLENLGRRLLNGSLPLWQAFWGIFVPTPLILYLVYIAIYTIWMEWTPITLKEVELFTAGFSLVALGTMTLLGIGVLKCSKNARLNTLKWVARIIVVGYVGWYATRVFVLLSIVFSAFA